MVHCEPCGSDFAAESLARAQELRDELHAHTACNGKRRHRLIDDAIPTRTAKQTRR